MTRPNKYRAVRTVIDGIAFDSKGEANRYAQLKIEERAGFIRNLECQPAFPLVVNGEKIGVYKGDFRYFTAERMVVEDYKGMDTPVSALKRKLVKAIYQVDVILVGPRQKRKKAA